MKDDVRRDAAFARYPQPYVAQDIEEVAIDVSGHSRRRCPAPALRQLALAGRLVPEKGVADAVEVLAEVRRHRNARLVVVGSGPEAARIPELAPVVVAEARALIAYVKE